MQVRISHWPKGAISPLVFMVDDLANIYFNQCGGDWGGRKISKGGLYDFLNENIINEFPWVKFTFFLVTDVRTPQVYGSYDYVKPCISDDFPAFLKRLETDGHEIAYHGTTHGVVIDGNFVQEWDAFATLNEAVNTINKGKYLYSSALNHMPMGGKYCGYAPGLFGHESILRADFHWWFDRWDSDVKVRPGGEWCDGLFYFPSNIDCSHYTISMIGKVPFYKYIKSLYRLFKDGNPYNRVSKVLEVQGILTFQEHSSPIRTDSKRQYPNVVDDNKFIKKLLTRLSEYNIWYATATEVYLYEKARRDLKLEFDVNNKRLRIVSALDSYPDNFKITLEFPERLSIRLQCDSVEFNYYKYGSSIYVDVESSFFNRDLVLD